ncbi:MAG: Fe(2+) transporter permease subunit FeoB [Kiritimatiellia bacterium]
MKVLRIAIAGNPNCGKTTVFNALTGARQRVGNWPGVTVERLEGRYQHADRVVQVVDLPGIYSFSANSADERVAREFILRERPDVVVNVLDATNLERNLYLTTMLLDMHVPLVVVLNMMDLARQRHLRLEIEHLARHLDCAVIPVVANKGAGIVAVKDAIAAVAASGHRPATRTVYDADVEQAIAALLPEIAASAETAAVDARWLAIKMLEEDPIATEILGGRHVEKTVGHLAAIRKHSGDAPDIVIADGRYGFIHGLARDVLHRDLELRRTITDMIDRVILNRALGIPLFFAVMFGVFFLTVNVGEPFIGFFEVLTGTLFVDGLRHLLVQAGLPEVIVAFMADGVGQGIQTVSTFIPPIFFIFLCLSVLEDSGYMARAAFVMDRLLRLIGLPGKAFLPMLVGFGCNVPGILATRTLENERDRRLAILMNPFMSCGARLPVYTMFAVVFFPQRGGQLIFGLYVTGIILAVLTGLLLKRTLMPGTPSTFVMELPPYHIPTFNGIMLHTWHRLKGFVLRAGQVILAIVILISVLGALDHHFGAEAADRDGLLERVGKRVTPVFGPMGIEQDNWPATVGLITGIFAKEAVAGTLDALYRGAAEERDEPFSFRGGVGDAFREIPAGFMVLFGAEEKEEEASTAAGAMRSGFGSTAAVIAYLLFVLIYCPCLAVVGAIYQESGMRWAIFSTVYLTVLAWVVATMFFQVSQLGTTPGPAMGWLMGCVLFLIIGAAGLSGYGKRKQA